MFILGQKKEGTEECDGKGKGGRKNGMEEPETAYRIFWEDQTQFQSRLKKKKFIADTVL